MALDIRGCLSDLSSLCDAVLRLRSLRCEERVHCELSVQIVVPTVYPQTRHLVN